MGAPRVPPLNPSESIVLWEHYRRMKSHQWRMRFHAFRRCVFHWDARNRAPLCLQFPVCGWSLNKFVYDEEGSEYSDVSLHFLNLNQTAWRWQWNLWSSIHLDFRFSYQISLSEEPRRYLMFKIVFIFAVHLSSSNIKGFFQTKDMHDPPPLSLAPILMEDLKCAQSNEKSIFRFLFFEL